MVEMHQRFFKADVSLDAHRYAFLSHDRSCNHFLRNYILHFYLHHLYLRPQL